MARRAAPIAAASSPSVAGTIASASIIGRGSRRASSVANRLEQQIGGGRHDAAEHEHLGIGDDDQVGGGHAEILRGVAHHRDRHAVAAARAAQHVIDRDRGEIAVDRVGHARPIAGLDAPDQAAHDAGRRDFRFEAADLAVVLAFDRVERQPGDRRGAAVRAEHRRAVADDAGDRVLGDGEEDRRRGATRRADPRFGDGRRGARRRRAELHERSGVTLVERGDDRGRSPAICRIAPRSRADRRPRPRRPRRPLRGRQPRRPPVDCRPSARAHDAPASSTATASGRRHRSSSRPRRERSISADSRGPSPNCTLQLAPGRAAAATAVARRHRPAETARGRPARAAA